MKMEIYLKLDMYGHVKNVLTKHRGYVECRDDRILLQSREKMIILLAPIYVMVQVESTNRELDEGQSWNQSTYLFAFRHQFSKFNIHETVLVASCYVSNAQLNSRGCKAEQETHWSIGYRLFSIVLATVLVSGVERK